MEENHKDSMKHFDKEYSEVKDQVYKETEKNYSRTKIVVIVVVAAAALIIGMITLLMVGPLKKSVRKASISNNSADISEKMYAMLDEGDYKGLSDYSDEIDALDNDSFAEEYCVLMAARYYTWTCSYMKKDGDNYNLTEDDVRYLVENLQQFYYYTQKSAYKNNNVTITDKNIMYLNKMRADMGKLLIEYYHLTEEDIDKIDTYSEARMSKCIIERSREYESR